MDRAAPPTTPPRRLRSADAKMAAIQPSSHGRGLRMPKTAKAAQSARKDSLAGVIGANIMTFYEVDDLKKMLLCYKTGKFPYHTWFATFKGTCAACWEPFPRLACVTRHSVVPGLVVHASCKHGPLPNCADCEEEASAGLAFRKIRNQKKIRCSRCARKNSKKDRDPNTHRCWYDIPANDIDSDNDSD